MALPLSLDLDLLRTFVRLIDHGGDAAKTADELGINPVESSFGSLGFGGETNFHPGYRELVRRLADAAGGKN